MRLIDADELLTDPYFQDESMPERELFIEAVEDSPTVDAEPVRYSTWEYEGDGYYFCKACKKYIVCIGGDADLNYCPNCGTYMDGDKGAID